MLGPHARSTRSAHQLGPHARFISSVHMLGPHARSISSGPSARSTRSGPHARSTRTVHQLGPSARSARSVHTLGPAARFISSVHTLGPQNWSTRSVHQLGPYQLGPHARSTSSVHQLDSSARSTRSVHTIGPHARSISSVHQLGPSARSIRKSDKPGQPHTCSERRAAEKGSGSAPCAGATRAGRGHAEELPCLLTGTDSRHWHCSPADHLPATTAAYVQQLGSIDSGGVHEVRRCRCDGARAGRGRVEAHPPLLQLAGARGSTPLGATPHSVPPEIGKVIAFYVDTWPGRVPRLLTRDGMGYSI